MKSSRHHGTNDAIDAQAIYQKGDMLWREAKGVPTYDAATTLETLLQKSRGDQKFNALKIYVQTPDSTADAPRFTQKTVLQVLGGPGNTDPNSVLHRVDSYYQTTGLYQAVDKMVHFFGNQPPYSYGLTILFFAVCTRVLMQPLTKKQYDSMKGMQVIAPEMKKIQEKYKGKTEQQAQMTMVKEIQDLQRRHGVSPMMGCGLGLIQIPIFFYDCVARDAPLRSENGISWSLVFMDQQSSAARPCAFGALRHHNVCVISHFIAATNR